MLLEFINKISRELSSKYLKNKNEIDIIDLKYFKFEEYIIFIFFVGGENK